jgi:hypothetical protein
MIAAAVRSLSTALKAAGFYTGPETGQRTTDLDDAARRLVEGRKAELSADMGNWSNARVTVAAYQLVLKEKGQELGAIDGLWGTRTQFAHDNQQHIEEFGEPITFRDVTPGGANPNHWPRDDVPSQAALNAFYGRCGVPGGFTPQLAMVECPWTLKIAWNMNQRTNRIGCHPKVAASLSRVLKRVFEHYGTARISELRLDVYGGCYNPRKKRGGSTWSMHSWGIALDFDPDNNQLRWGRDRATFARPAYDPWWEAWEAEGWVSLGRQKNFDWMHVQAALL